MDELKLIYGNDYDDNSSQVRNMLSRNEKGLVIPSAENFLRIFRNDNFFKNVYLDIMRMAGCRVYNDGHRVYWDDTEDAKTRTHIETAYGLRHATKTDDALKIFLSQRRFSPVQEAIKKIQWDGKPHVKGLYIRCLDAEDSTYTEEVTRLDYLQRINRAFVPGCKADNASVLKGSQGIGKSTMNRLSALEDDFYTSVSTIEGQRGYEAIQGKFICELEELLAVVGEGTRKESAVKSFISGQSDHYRRPYDRRASDNPRTCVFVGTTNRDKFLSDPTGNRRWFPIECHLKDGSRIFEHEKEIREEIRQAYAEMYYAWQHHLPLASPIPDKALYQVIRTRQEASELDDYRVGLIVKYLGEHKPDSVCIIELWERALCTSGRSQKAITRTDANEIGELLRNKLGCKPLGKKYFRQYGTQHAFDVPEELRTAPNDA